MILSNESLEFGKLNRDACILETLKRLNIFTSNQDVV